MEQLTPLISKIPEPLIKIIHKYSTNYLTELYDRSVELHGLSETYESLGYYFGSDMIADEMDYENENILWMNSILYENYENNNKFTCKFDKINKKYIDELIDILYELLDNEELPDYINGIRIQPTTKVLSIH